MENFTVHGVPLARHIDAEADLDRHNNLMQALALLQFAAGVEVTAVVAGDVHYIARVQAAPDGA